MSGSMRIPAALYDEAGTWFALHRAGDLDEADRRRFDAWLRASPQHVQAYLEISSAWEEVAQLPRGAAREPAALIMEALGESNVYRFNGSEGGSRPEDSQSDLPAPTSSDSNRNVRRSFLALAAVIVFAAVGILAWHSHAAAYTTGIGEQRQITLPDGSRLELNALSRVEVRFGKRERRIDLSSGQALFNVAKDPRRPFVVHAGSSSIRAVGTAFDVYRRAGDTTVTVVDGRVAVTPASALELQPVLLAAGQKLTVPAVAPKSGRRMPLPQATDVRVATAWTQRRLILQSSPLREVVQEFNRYNTRSLRVTDPSLESYRVSGVFSSTDPAPLLHFLRLQPVIEVTETDSEVRISRK